MQLPAISPVTQVCATPSLPTGAGSGFGQNGSTAKVGPRSRPPPSALASGSQTPVAIATASRLPATVAPIVRYRVIFMSFSSTDCVGQNYLASSGHFLCRGCLYRIPIAVATGGTANRPGERELNAEIVSLRRSGVNIMAVESYYRRSCDTISPAPSRSDHHRRAGSRSSPRPSRTAGGRARTRRHARNACGLV